MTDIPHDHIEDGRQEPTLRQRLKAAVRQPTVAMGRKLLLAASLFVAGVMTLIVVDTIKARATPLPEAVVERVASTIPATNDDF